MTVLQHPRCFELVKTAGELVKNDLVSLGLVITLFFYKNQYSWTIGLLVLNFS